MIIDIKYLLSINADIQIPANWCHVLRFVLEANIKVLMPKWNSSQVMKLVQLFDLKANIELKVT